jgi:hypothetical protein
MRTLPSNTETTRNAPMKPALHKYAKRAIILIATVGILVATLGIIYLCGRFLMLVDDQHEILQMMREDASDKQTAKRREANKRESEDNLNKIMSGEIKLSPETEKSIDEIVRKTKAQLIKDGYKGYTDADIKERVIRLYSGDH